MERFDSNATAPEVHHRIANLERSVGSLKVTL
jgi:hypothetical protein